MYRFASILFWFFVVLFGVPVAIALGQLILSSIGSVTRPATRTVQDIAAASVSSLRPDGKLAEVFGILSGATAVQREETKREITGKIVEWRVPVYDVDSSSDG